MMHPPLRDSFANSVQATFDIVAFDLFCGLADLDLDTFWTLIL